MVRQCPHGLRKVYVDLIGMIVLGLSRGQGGHDTSAAILVDGKLVAAAEEERFIREKWAMDLDCNYQ